MDSQKASALFCVVLSACLLAGCGGSAASASLLPAASEPIAAESPSPAQATPAPAEVSPAAEDAAVWEQQALLLTTQIVESCLQPFDESVGVTEVNDREIFNFVATLSQYAGEAGYPYAGAVTVTETSDAGPSLVAHVPEQTAQAIAGQLFAQPDWFFDAPDCYDGDVPEYRFNLEAGPPVSPYSCQDAAAVFAGDTVTVSFRLTGSLRFVGATGEPLAEYGSYQAVYRLLSKGESSFLRLESIQPA